MGTLQNIKKKGSLSFIKYCIKGMRVKDLYSILGIVENYPDTDKDKPIVMEMLRKEFVKRKLPPI